MKPACSLLVSILALALLCVPAHASASGPGPAAPALVQDPEYDLEATLERIGGLNSSHLKRLLATCTAAAKDSGAPQVELVRLWSEGLAGTADKLPERTVFEAHDARKYKGGPPRRTIGPRKKRWDALYARLRSSPADPRPAHMRAVLYEFSTGILVQRESKKAAKTRKQRDKRRPSTRAEAGLEQGPEQPLRELLEGVLPGQAAAEEALLQAIDARGVLRAEAEFFAHLYCDREANAYEGIPLFDLWSMPSEFEVPDPDARAYAQLIWDDATVPLPLTERDHDDWYPRMERSYKNLRTHMFTARALAAVWFEGRPELSSGYANSIDIMNAAIALCESDPGRMADLLEASGANLLTEAKEQIEARGNDVWNAGNARRDEFATGKLLIREAVLEVLAAEGLL